MILREDCIRIGEVGKTHGLNGALVIHSDIDLLDMPEDEPVFLLLEGMPVPFFIAPEGITPRGKNAYIVKFDYVDSITQAERLTGHEVMVEASLLEEEESGELSVADLVGFQVYDRKSGETGEVSEVADYSGNIVLTIKIYSKAILLPFADHYIKEILSEEQMLHVEIPEELAALY